MIKSEDGIKRRGDFFWAVGDFSFEKDTIGHIFTGKYYGLQPLLTYRGNKKSDHYPHHPLNLWKSKQISVNLSQCHLLHMAVICL